MNLPASWWTPEWPSPNDREAMNNGIAVVQRRGISTTNGYYHWLECSRQWREERPAPTMPARISIALLACVLIGTGRLKAQDSTTGPTAVPPITTDRPSVTDSSTVVPKDVLQMENGFLFNGSQGLRTFDVPETLIRFGLTSKTELRFYVPDYYYTQSLGLNAGAAPGSGFGDLAIGVKQQLLCEARRIRRIRGRVCQFSHWSPRHFQSWVRSCAAITVVAPAVPEVDFGRHAVVVLPHAGGQAKSHGRAHPHTRQATDRTLERLCRVRGRFFPARRTAELAASRDHTGHHKTAAA